MQKVKESYDQQIETVKEQKTLQLKEQDDSYKQRIIDLKNNLQIDYSNKEKIYENQIQRLETEKASIYKVN